MNNDIEHIICGINAKENLIYTAQIMNNRIVSVKSMVIESVLQNPFLKMYNNITLEYDGSGTLGKRKFRSLDELLHPEKYSDTDLWYDANMEAFVGNIRIMANSGARNIETFNAKYGGHVYVIRDDGYHNITIVIPSDIIAADTLKSTLTGTRGIFTNDKRDDIVYDSITVIGGSPNLLSIDGLLANCSAKRLDMSRLCVESLRSISYLFEDAWIEDMNTEWLRGCELLSVTGAFNGLYTNNGIIDLSCLNTSRVKDMSKMFCDANVFELCGCMDTSNVTDMSSMFSNFNIKIEYRDVKRNLDLSWMNTSKVIKMNHMFKYCALDAINVGWKCLAELQSICGIFSGVSKTNIIGMEHWRTPRLLDVTDMFNDANIRGGVIVGGDFPRLSSSYTSMFYNAWIDLVDFTEVRIRDDGHSESDDGLVFNAFTHFTGTLLFNKNYDGTKPLVDAIHNFRDSSSQGKNIDLTLI